MLASHVYAALYFLAAVGNLSLANLVVFRSRRAVGALPIALLCLALFVWDMGLGMVQLTGEELGRWKYLALIGSSMAPAFLMHFVIVFCRREAPLRRWLAVLYAVTALFTLLTAGAMVRTDLREFVNAAAWNVAYLVALFPFLVWALLLVFRRRGEVQSVVERNALNFVALAIAVGVLTALADLTKRLGSPLPFVGHAGSLLCTVILAVAIFRHRLLQSESPVRRTFLVFAIAAAAVLLNVWFVLRIKPSAGPTAVGIAAVTAAALILYRVLLLNWVEIAERRRRLALIGTMAAGVAHEIKNPLASIKGATQLVQKELEGGAAGDGARDYLKLVVGEVDRLNGVIEDFLSYARPREPRRQDVSLNELVEGVLKLQRTALPPGVELKHELDPTLPVVSGDSELLKQALFNVLKNAIDAADGRGAVTVRTRSVPEALRWYEVLEVEDTGPGVPPDDMERIFQPFYTTKTRGTGLGLAIAARILEAHHGWIAVESVAPRGAKFSFHIPRRRL